MTRRWKPRRGASARRSGVPVALAMTLALPLAVVWIKRASLPDGALWFVALAVGALGLVCAVVWVRRRNAHARRAALWMKRQQTLESLRALDWKAFEELVAVAFRKQGWTADVVGGGGADGGVDIELRRGPRKRLVQCKHWRGRVGIKPVREMVGLIQHHHAERGLLVATGGFTSECWHFVQGKQIDLIDGKRLLGLLGRAGAAGEKTEQEDRRAA
ncbi:restriction endonuclease [Pseudomarimonas arenosa]|uniref:Restriction endonuclease n=1 Tax=Pseudomarimonas arenosa TaxID=2774145 RepID=A0AAW3ZH93_9GAMM|nr:restriction endonuclease [Pseudomarimonas arenosa]MBD8524129.1 restriction endonuclease [Pseudomarimonas arenosa]